MKPSCCYCYCLTEVVGTPVFFRMPAWCTCSDSWLVAVAAALPEFDFCDRYVSTSYCFFMSYCDVLVCDCCCSVSPLCEPLPPLLFLNWFEGVKFP